MPSYIELLVHASSDVFSTNSCHFYSISILTIFTAKALLILR